MMGSFRQPPTPATVLIEERKECRLSERVIIAERRLETSLMTAWLARGLLEASCTAERMRRWTTLWGVSFLEAASRMRATKSKIFSPSASLVALLKAISSRAVEGGESSNMRELKAWRRRSSE